MVLLTIGGTRRRITSRRWRNTGPVRRIGGASRRWPSRRSCSDRIPRPGAAAYTSTHDRFPLPLMPDATQDDALALPDLAAMRSAQARIAPYVHRTPALS